jgi:hypothetical protein
MQHPPKDKLPSDFTLQLKVPSGNTIIFDNNNALNLLVTGNTYNIQYNGQPTNQKLTYLGNGQCRIGENVYNPGDLMIISASGADKIITVPFYAAGTMTTGAAVAIFNPCLTIGTNVLTNTGYKAVETLTSDDLIVTPDNRSLTFNLYKINLNTTKETLPVVFKAGFFGKNKPIRDLAISQDHAIEIQKDNWIIPRHIQRLPRKPVHSSTIDYYHIELPDFKTDHIICEGLVLESYGCNQIDRNTSVYSQTGRTNIHGISVPVMSRTYRQKSTSTDTKTFLSSKFNKF